MYSIAVYEVIDLYLDFIYICKVCIDLMYNDVHMYLNGKVVHPRYSIIPHNISK